MVLLCMTQTIISCVDACQATEASAPSSSLSQPPIPTEAKLGDPISHAQLLALQERLRELRRQNQYEGPCELDELLRGSSVWLEPPKPKPEPTEEYKALMARLRAEQEAQSYARMLSTSPNPLPSSSSFHPAQSFTQRFPNSQYAYLFPDSTASLPARLASARQVPSQYAQEQSNSVLYDDASLATVNRQLALIGNVFVSIVATAIAIWWATWHWSTIARLSISMGGSGLVGIAEIVVYLGYIQRLDSAKSKEVGKKERKKVTKTWVIEGRRGNIEKRTVADQDSRQSGMAKRSEAIGDWPQPPDSLRKRNTMKSMQ